jgi:hypothetical protein
MRGEIAQTFESIRNPWRSLLRTDDEQFVGLKPQRRIMKETACAFAMQFMALVHVPCPVDVGQIFDKRPWSLLKELITNLPCVACQSKWGFHLL